jgi:hypothetical protein
MPKPLVSAALSVLMLTALVACRPAPSVEYRVHATVKELMDSIVDPSSDAIWGSVEVVATLEGTVEKQPKTDDDWKTLRRHAVSLIEASNLLLMPGRRVARPGEKAEDARVDLQPEEIEARIAQDRSVWVSHAHTLQEAALETLEAIDARSVKALVDTGETLDQACETCHKTYWYRPSPLPVNDPPPKPEH